jgi:hypothetical protein
MVVVAAAMAGIGGRGGAAVAVPATALLWWGTKHQAHILLHFLAPVTTHLCYTLTCIV